MPLALYHLLWCGLLLATVVAADEGALARDVRVQPPTISGIAAQDTVIYNTSGQLPDADLAAGQILLHRHGCTTCHQLAIPRPARPTAPRLDAIGHKTSAAWLSAWLENPFAYLPASKMPQVALTRAEREALVAFLQTLAPRRHAPAIPQRPAAPHRGAALFKRLECLQCHQVDGEGGVQGPALDRLGHKTGRRWLYTLLKTPQLAQPGTQSHTYHLVDQDALDLSTYLARRFGGPGSDSAADTARVDSDHSRAGLAVALDRHCFECHRIGPYDGPVLAVPVAATTAREWVDHHARSRGALPAFAAAPRERRLMAKALQVDPAGLRPAATGQARLPDDFWQRPIAAGSPLPYSPDAQSLAPDSCADCHVRQAREWGQSRHAQALSPGLLSQLVGALEDTATVALCLTCHAPRQDQFDALLAEPQPGPGIDCAGCHVRAHLFFGPPADPLRSPAERFSGGHHGAPVLSPAFRQSAFCAPCHQFDDEGLAFNGNLLQNTHREWAQSPQRQNGETCQSCHMPDGRHTWPGIRDPALVGGALDLAVVRQPDPAGIRAEIRLHNRGAGHHLPTYATPAILVKTFLADQFGRAIESTLQVRAVQRALRLDENRELFDTRIPAGGAWIFDFSSPRPAAARFLQVVVEVDPDYFYRSFFAEFAGPEGRELARQAHARLLDSPYILFAQSHPLE